MIGSILSNCLLVLGCVACSFRFLEEVRLTVVDGVQDVLLCWWSAFSSSTRGGSES